MTDRPEGPATCHVCGRKTLYDTARRDWCTSCGYEFYYGDAYATGDAAVSRLVNPGLPEKPEISRKERG